MSADQKADSVAVQRLLLERISFYAQLTADAGALTPSIVDYEARRIVTRLRSDIWAQKLQDERVTLSATFHADWPATWWQHFKQRWFPAWALRRWPVALATKDDKQERTHTFRTVALLPEFKYRSPDGCGQCVIASMVDSW